MLDQLARHALIDLDGARPRATCTSTTTTRSRTSASRSARRWRRRWATSAASAATAHFDLVMDDARGRAPRSTSRGGPGSPSRCRFTAPKIGTFDTELVREFFQALSTHGGITLHVDRVRGLNAHHVAEATFKAVARALRMAVEPDPRAGDAIPSTKGSL